MARNKIRVSRRMLFAWFMLASLILLLAPQSLTNNFQFAFARIFSWPLSIGRSISLSVRTQYQLEDVVGRREYDKLQNHLTNVILQRDQEHERAEKLSGMRNRGIWQGASIVPADVATVSIDGSGCELIINRGKNDGLAKDQYVCGGNSIIGVVSDVSSRMARVKLFSDPLSVMKVNIAQLKVDMLMQGAGGGLAVIRMAKYEVKIGDNVYAAKKPAFLDAPMIAGKVTRCERNDENPLLWDITVAPACDIEKLNDVAVIIMNPHGQLRI